MVSMRFRGLLHRVIDHEEFEEEAAMLLDKLLLGQRSLECYR